MGYIIISHQSIITINGRHVIKLSVNDDKVKLIMTKFIVGDQYSYKGDAPVTYVGESTFHGVGLFEGDSGKIFRYRYENMTPRTKPEPKYPNLPLPHCEERIAFAKGANIAILSERGWYHDINPAFDAEHTYKIIVEPIKTKDDLRIEKIERHILEHEHFLDKFKKELAELKPTVHY
jgi:hypothetical protein